MYVRAHTLFSTMHPLVLFVYSWGALILAMLSDHPLFVTVSFAAAVVCNAFYYGFRSVGKTLTFIVPVIALIAGMNLFFNHRGMTILFQIGHTAYTAESLFYGFVSGMMLGAVMLWFKCYTAIVSNEKFLYLFGRKFAGTALLLSMILKLFPETKYKIRCIRNAQKDDEESGKLKKAMKQISCLLEWSMEDSIETADSMRARGYGRKKRSSYELHHFTAVDGVWTFYYLTVFLLIGVLRISGAAKFTYYPVISNSKLAGAEELIVSGIYMIVLLSPIILEAWDMILQTIRRKKYQDGKG